MRALLQLSPAHVHLEPLVSTKIGLVDIFYSSTAAFTSIQNNKSTKCQLAGLALESLLILRGL